MKKFKEFKVDCKNMGGVEIVAEHLVSIGYKIESKFKITRYMSVEGDGSFGAYMNLNQFESARMKLLTINEALLLADESVEEEEPERMWQVISCHLESGEFRRMDEFYSQDEIDKDTSLEKIDQEWIDVLDGKIVNRSDSLL